MAKWKVVAKSKSIAGSYIGWKREHPEIHIGKQPMRKVSLVQVSSTTFPTVYTVLAQTVAHSVFAPPPSRGTMLFKKRVQYKTEQVADNAVARFKKLLAKKFDKVTGEV